ncbi:MAG: hypothetical protein ACOX16_02770 [Candidatus Izemoplasmatales bacterium]|jgi:hypothetical protein
MNIVNKTLYDKQLIISYNRYYLLGFLKTNFLVVSLITAGLMVYMILNEMWEYSLVFLGILALYFLLTLILQALTTKKVLKESPLVKNPITQTYVFTDTEILVESLKQTKLPYTEINRIRSTGVFFIITDFSKRTYIVQKSGFANQKQDVTELANFFKATLGKRFR